MSSLAFYGFFGLPRKRNIPVANEAIAVNIKNRVDCLALLFRIMAPTTFPNMLAHEKNDKNMLL